MGKILLSNSTEIFNKMHESYRKVGFRISFFENEEKRNISCYKKIYIDNENVWYAEDGTAVISVGTFIYKNEIKEGINTITPELNTVTISTKIPLSLSIISCVFSHPSFINEKIYGLYALFTESIKIQTI